jgi:protein translocase SecG subunit
VGYNSFVENTILVLQILVSLFLIIAITIQVRGGGLQRGVLSGNAFTRRGFEKLLFKATFIFCGIFLLISSLRLVF